MSLKKFIFVFTSIVLFIKLPSLTKCGLNEKEELISNKEYTLVSSEMYNFDFKIERTTKLAKKRAIGLRSPDLSLIYFQEPALLRK